MKGIFKARLCHFLVLNVIMMLVSVVCHHFKILEIIEWLKSESVTRLNLPYQVLLVLQTVELRFCFGPYVFKTTLTSFSSLDNCL